jgi:hypothetical protein
MASYEVFNLFWSSKYISRLTSTNPYFRGLPMEKLDIKAQPDQASV